MNHIPCTDTPRLTHLGRLYFLHIPKAAGTSLRLWLEGLFDVAACCPHYHPFELADDPAEELARHCFFTGHHQWRFAERWGAALGLQAVTFLRDPIARGASELRYQRQFTPEEAARWRDRTWVRGWVLDLQTQMSDDQIVRLPRFIAEEGNRQTRELGLVDADLPPGRVDQPAIEVGERHLEAATAHLASMAGFGLVEEMERSALLIADALGLPARPIALRANVTGAAAAAPSREMRAALGGSNRLDLRLYEAARALFAARFAALLSRYGQADDAAGHAALAARLDADFAARDRGVALLPALFADMSRGMVLDGFQQRFFYPPLGRWLRWSQGPVARLWLPIDRARPRSLVLDIAFFTDDAARDGLRVEIDGRPVPSSLDYPRWPVPAGQGADGTDGTDEAHHVAVGVELPALAVSPQYTQIALRLPPGGPGTPGVQGAPEAALALAHVRVA
ncbi:MAG: hypothetical protein ACXIVF_20085 [Rhizobiaceae bacterium]